MTGNGQNEMNAAEYELFIGGQWTAGSGRVMKDEMAAIRLKTDYNPWEKR